MKNIILAAFSLLCLACIIGIGIVVYDVVSTASNSSVSGFGAVAVFVMAVAFGVRHLWENRQAGD